MHTKTPTIQGDRIRAIAAVIGIHILGGYSITRYLTTHTQTKSVVGTLFILLVLLYFLSEERKTIHILKNLWTYTKQQWTRKKSLYTLAFNVLIGLLITIGMFGILELGTVSGFYEVPKHSLHQISLLYILVSVPVQQLVFFILPERIAGGRLEPMVLSALAIPFFGIVHGYYPDFMTIITTAATLGIASSYLVFYKHDYYAAIITHIIAGSVALTIGLV